MGIIIKNEESTKMKTFSLLCCLISCNSSLLQFSNQTLYFVILNFDQLFHLLNLQLQYLHSTFEFFNCVVLLNESLFELLVLGLILDWLPWGWLPFWLGFLLSGTVFLFLYKRLNFALCRFKHPFDYIRRTSDNMINVIFADLIIDLF